MNSTNRFFDGSFDESNLYAPVRPNNSFEAASHDQLTAHLQVDRYGAFQLTDAVRPAIDLKVKPVQGYRHDVYVDDETSSKVPVIMAAATREILFPLFMELVQKLGPVVDVVLETSHDSESRGHTDLYREHIDLPVLTSTLWEFEDLLTNDGCTGIAVLNPGTPQEVQFDEHKLLIMYGSPLEQFEHVLEIRGVTCQPKMRFITEAEHVHSSTDEYAQLFESLRTDLGLDGIQQAGQDHDHGFQA
jgi:hypothetical protein